MIRVLVIEDAAVTARIVADMLRTDRRHQFEAHCVGTLAEALRFVGREPVDAAVLDLGLPDSQGIASLEKLVEGAPGLPIVVLTGVEDDEIPFDAMEKGAQGYLIKGRHDSGMLIRSILYAVRHKQAQDDLQASEARWLSLVENAPNIIMVTDREGRIRFINRTVSGLSVKDVIGKPLYDYIEPRYHELVRTTTDKAFETGRPQSYEIEGTGPDGTKSLYRTLVSPVRRGGRIDAAILIASDITAQKKAEDTLVESELKFRTIFDSALDGIFLLDLETKKFAMCNPVCARMLGVTRREFVKLDIADIHPEQDLPRIYEEIGKFENGGQGMARDIRFRRKDGSVFFADLNPTLITIVGRKYILVTIKDISDRKRGEESLRESEEWYRTLFYHAQDGIGMADAETGILMDCNLSLCRMVGRTRDELVGKPQSVLHVPEEIEGNFSRTFRQHQLEDPSMVVQDRLLSSSGRTVPVEIRAARISVRRHEYILGIFRDLTERSRVEEELRRHRDRLAHVERVAAFGEVGSSLAHEINQPLAAVLSNAQAAQNLLSADNPDLGEVREILADIVADNKRAGEVVRRIRTLLKMEEPAYGPIEIASVVQSVLRIAGGDEVMGKLSVATDLAPQMPKVRADPVQIQQVLLNLVLNAAQAMSGMPAESQKVVISSRTGDSGGITVSVADSGPGIPKENLDMVFDPFISTKPEGMGLGLSISRFIVEAHGGKIWAENNPSGGAKVSFCLPEYAGKTPITARGRKKEE